LTLAAFFFFFFPVTALMTGSTDKRWASLTS
jgi:hypothetical protein